MEPLRRNGIIKFMDDAELRELNREQRKLSRRIYHPGKRNAVKVRQLRRFRSSIK